MGRMASWLSLDEDSLLWKAIALSLLIHALILSLGGLSGPSIKPVMEINLTGAITVGPAAAVQPHPRAAPPPPPPKKNEWVEPAKPHKWVPPPKPIKAQPRTPPPPAPATTSSSSIGSIGGEASLNQLSRLPQLLNLDALAVLLQKFYPEQARLRGIQSVVVLDMHLNTEGRVTAVDVVESGGSAFDAAAVRAAKLLRFTPAYIGSEPVAVKLRQALQFKLDNQTSY